MQKLEKIIRKLFQDPIHIFDKGCYSMWLVLAHFLYSSIGKYYSSNTEFVYGDNLRILGIDKREVKHNLGSSRYLV